MGPLSVSLPARKCALTCFHLISERKEDGSLQSKHPFLLPPLIWALGIRQRAQSRFSRGIRRLCCRRERPNANRPKAVSPCERTTAVICLWHSTKIMGGGDRDGWEKLQRSQPQVPNKVSRKLVPPSKLPITSNPVKGGDPRQSYLGPSQFS